MKSFFSVLVMVLVQVIVLVLVLVSPQRAWARASNDFPYTVNEAFSAGVRFVRIDRGCKVVDKDADAAFVTFECKEEEHTRRGSLEIFKTAVNGRDGVRVQVSLGDEPRYAEWRFLELLERKLREERGTPPPPVANAPKKPQDGGTP